MAITHVAAFGSNGSKSAGTTLAVTAAPGTQPAIGDLIVVSCSRDDIANDPLTGDSVSDGYGNTYTRQVFAGGSAATDSTAGNAINLVVFYCVLTVAWSGTTTVTWTHPSLTARGMQVEHFAPDSGYTVALYDTPVSSNAFAASTTVVTTTSPTPAGDLVFGVAAVANDTTSTITGDSDTVGGSWSTVTTPAGTTGGTGNTNAFVVTQYKILTFPTTQAWGITHGATSSNSAAALLTFHQYPAAGPYLVGIGTQAPSATGNVTPKLPPGTTTNDLLVLVVGGRPSSSSADGVTIASGTDGWAQHGSTSYVAVAAVDDLSVQVWWKLHDGSESDPTVSVNTVLAQAAAIDRGYSAQIAAFRNVNTSTPFDVTAVTSNTGAAAATFTPTGVTTVTNGALALSLVASSDDNSLNFNTSQSFVLAFGGDEYDTNIGADHAVGLAWKIISAAGAVTEPTWNQSVNGNDQWVGLSTALRSFGSAYTIDGSTGLTTAVAGGLTAAFPLAASTALTTTTTGALTVAHPVDATTSLTFVVAGALTVAHPLAGTTVLTTALAGDLTASLTLAGTTALAFTTSGDFAAVHPLAGTTTLTTTTSGTLAAGLALAGTTTLTTTLAGDLTGNTGLEGATSLTTTLAGALTVAHPLDGATGFTTDTDGTLTLTVVLALEGATSLTVATGGDLMLTVALDGTSSVTTTLAGDLTEILGPNAYLLGRVVGAVVNTSILANVIDTPILVSVGGDRIEASVR